MKTNMTEQVVSEAAFASAQVGTEASTQAVSKCSFNEGSNYSREGQLVVGSYLGMYPEACAVVEASRATYGGKIKHYCKLVRQLKTEFVLYEAGEMLGLMEDDLTACFMVLDIN